MSDRFEDHMSEERREQYARFASGGSILGFIISLVIYYKAGDAGKAPCSTDLAGWHWVNAWVSLAGVVSPIACIGVIGNVLACIGMPSPTMVRSLNQSVVTAINIFLFVWFILGNQRLWGIESTLVCGGVCCSHALWHATTVYFIFIYVLLGVGVVFCCCCCCCFGSLMVATHAGKGGARSGESTPLQKELRKDPPA